MDEVPGDRVERRIGARRLRLGGSLGSVLLRPEGGGPRGHHTQACLPHHPYLQGVLHDRGRRPRGVPRPRRGAYVREEPGAGVAVGRIPPAAAGEGVRASRLDLGGGRFPSRWNGAPQGKYGAF